MRDLADELRSDFRNQEFRHSYAESFLNTKLSAQLRTLRLQRGYSVLELANLAGVSVATLRRYEDTNNHSWSVDTLKKIGRPLDVRLSAAFETFGTLIWEKCNFKRETLLRPNFADDPLVGSSPHVVPLSIADSAQSALESAIEMTISERARNYLTMDHILEATVSQEHSSSLSEKIGSRGQREQGDEIHGDRISNQRESVVVPRFTLAEPKR